MKEKTFEELIKEKTQRENFFILTDVGEKFMVQLMQQVREATIEECANIELDSCSSVEAQRRFDKLPTDRINLKTT